MASGRKPLSEILLQMRSYCGYQERCHSEVRTKLLKLHVYGDDLESIIAELVRDDFLNEERYARSFARGKFRINHWGRNKIRLYLHRKDISDYCIRKGLSEIDEDEYTQYIEEQIAHKLQKGDDFKARRKAGDALIRKGFEPALVWESMNALTRDK